MAEVWQSDDHAQRAKVAIQSADVDSDLSDFTFLVVIDGTKVLSADITSKRYRLYAEGNNDALPYDELQLDTGSTYAKGCAAVKCDPTAAADGYLWLYHDGNPGSDQDDPSNTYDSDIVAFVPLNEASGTLYDRTDNNNDGTASGDLPTAVDGVAEVDRQNLDGTGDYIDFDDIDIPATGAFSIVFNSDAAFSQSRTIWRSHDDSPLRLFDVLFTSTKLFFGWYDNGDNHRAVWNPVSGLSTETDYFLHGTWTNSGTTEVFIDGVSKASNSNLSATWDTSASGEGISNYLGRDPNAGGNDFDGKLGILTIQSSVRTTAWWKLHRLNLLSGDNSQTWSAAEDKPSVSDWHVFSVESTDDAVGTVDWDTTGNADADDNVYDTVDSTTTADTYYLTLTDADFDTDDFSASADIFAVEIEIITKGSIKSGPVYVTLSKARMIVGGSIQGTDLLGIPPGAFETSETTYQLSGDDDHAGEALDGSDLHASNFGVALSLHLQTTASTNIIGYVERVRVRAWYTSTAVPVDVTGGISDAATVGLAGGVAAGVSVTGGISQAATVGLAGTAPSGVTANGGIGTAATVGLAGGVSAGVSVTGGISQAATVGLAGTAPSGVTANGGIGTAAASGLAGGVSAGVSVTGGISQAAAVGLAGDVSAGGVGVTGGISQAAVVGLAGTAPTGVGPTGGIGSAAAVGLAGVAAAGVSVTGGISEAAVVGLAGTAPAGVGVTGGTGTAAAVGLQGSVSIGQNVTGGISQAASVGLAGSISAGGVDVTGGIGTAAAVGLAGSVSAGVSVTGGISQAAAVGLAGTAPSGVGVSGGIGTAAVSGFQGSVVAGVTVAGSISDSAVVGLAGVTAAGASVSGGISQAATVGLTGTAPTGVGANGGIGTAAAIGLAGGVSAGVSVTGGISQAATVGLTGTAPSGVGVIGGIGTAAAVGLAGGVNAGVSVSGGTSTATVLGLQGHVGIGEDVLVTGGIGLATCVGLAASLNIGVSAAGDVGLSAVTGLAATITGPTATDWSTLAMYHKNGTDIIYEMIWGYGKYFRRSTGTFVDKTLANRADLAIYMQREHSGSQTYVRRVPPNLPAGIYEATAYVQAGDDVAESDAYAGGEVFQWDGSRVVGITATGTALDNVKLAPDGLANIRTTTPTADEYDNPDWDRMLVMCWRHDYRPWALSRAGWIKHYADNGTTVLCTQDATDDGTVQLVGIAVGGDA